MQRARHRSAAVALFLGAILLCMGAPGFSGIGPHALATEAKKAKAARQFPRPLVEVGAALSALNRHVRIPISARLIPLQRLFRIRMDFHLYGEGPRQRMQVEVRVDGTLVYRTRDPDHAWMAPQLEYRRVQPTIETIAKKPNAYNWKGMGRYLVGSARRDFPDAQQVIISATRAPYGVAEAPTRHGRVAEAPEWTLRPLTPAERTGLDAGTWP